MFNADSTFRIAGSVLGLNIDIRVDVAAPVADASPLPSAGEHTLVLDVQNIQTLLQSKINTALIELQNIATGHASRDWLRPGRAVEEAAKNALLFPNPGEKSH